MTRADRATIAAAMVAKGWPQEEIDESLRGDRPDPRYIRACQTKRASGFSHGPKAKAGFETVTLGAFIDAIPDYAAANADVVVEDDVVRYRTGDGAWQTITRAEFAAVAAVF